MEDNKKDLVTKSKETKEEPKKPKDLTKVDEQREHILKILDDEDFREDETDVDMDLNTRVVNRFKFLNTVTTAAHQRKGDFWITEAPKMHISAMKPIINRDLGRIEFFVYEWDPKDHKNKNKRIGFTEFLLADGTTRKIPTSGEPVTLYKIIETFPKNTAMKREVINVVDREKEMMKKINSGEIKVRR